MKVYEAPKLNFENLTMFEKIACDRCWDAKSVSFDLSQSDNYDPISYNLRLHSMPCLNIPCNDGDPLFAARLWVADYFNIYTKKGLKDYNKWLKQNKNTDFPATGDSSLAAGFHVTFS